MDKKSMQTKLINKPLTRFKNPNSKSQPITGPLTQIGFELPDGRIKFFNLDNGVMLGRGPDTIDDLYKLDLNGVGGLSNGVSRNHTLIQIIDETVVVKDYDSLNGTFLNNAELYPMRNYVIQNGDVLAIGKVKIKIRFAAQKS